MPDDSATTPVTAQGTFVCPVERWFDDSAARVSLDALRLLSASHRTADMSELSDLALDQAGVDRLNRRLADFGIEAVVLATCNRTEVYWVSHTPEDDRATEAAFREATGADGVASAGAVRAVAGEAAARHLFRVACGIESMLVGEAEVLGQVGAVLEASPSAGLFLEGIFRAAVRTGRMARAETAIGEGALSVASSAVRLLAGTRDLATATVLVVGAGDTGTKAARHLADERVGCLIVINRTLERAQQIAKGLGAEAFPLEELPSWLRAADAVIVASRTAGWLLGAGVIAEAMAARPDRALVIIDVSMPRAVDPAASALPGVTVHDLSGLEAIVRENRERRAAEIPRVEALIERELRKLAEWARSETLRPLAAEIRSRAEQIRLAEVDRARAEDAAADPHTLRRLSRRLVDRLLSIPLAALRDGDIPIDTSRGCYLRRLFAPEDERSRGEP